jgi:LDH2 family malate/lactate/ureidoglycolate dehydrogenase
MGIPVTVGNEKLKLFVQRILGAVGLPENKALLSAEVLVAANLRGVDSHGVLLLPFYVEQFKAGNIDPQADGCVVSESGACIKFDGQHGVGQYVSAVCCDLAVKAARQHGLGMVVASRSNHFGIAAFWAARISAKGMAGIATTNASPIVAPWQGREGRIGTNPICLAVPSTGKGGWLLDMATTTVAKNRIVKAAASGESTIPAGWAMNSEGIPTVDVQEALNGLLMPLGGYKGSGLGMMVEILCGVLGGDRMSAEVGGLHIRDRKMNTSHTFIAIDIARFMPLEEFQSRMEQLIGGVKATKTAQGYDEVLVAGDPEWRMEAERLREGIPLEDGVWKRLESLAREYGVPMPS